MLRSSKFPQAAWSFVSFWFYGSVRWNLLSRTSFRFESLCQIDWCEYKHKSHAATLMSIFMAFFIDFNIIYIYTINIFIYIYRDKLGYLRHEINQFLKSRQNPLCCLCHLVRFSLCQFSPLFAHFHFHRCPEIKAKHSGKNRAGEC